MLAKVAFVRGIRSGRDPKAYLVIIAKIIEQARTDFFLAIL
jgi:hypothetical protein